MIDVVSLSPANLQDFLAFFDHDGFADNPEWASCYCQCYYEDHTKIRWASRTARENRTRACDRVEQGQMQGYLAYRGKKVVGWCNAAPRALLHSLDAEPVAKIESIGTIVCFLIDPTCRGQGIAASLLDGACRAFRAQGLEWAEANPRSATKSTTENHYGPLSMFLAAGFSPVRNDPDGSVWVQKRL
jgi:ribosomal protein S18 acetylase RimI-like enzyme